MPPYLQAGKEGVVLASPGLDVGESLPLSGNAAIGPPTRDALSSLGVQVMPQKATFPDQVRAVDQYLKGRESN